jgi:hypothetical protein
MKWLVDVTVGVGDSDATLTIEVEADSALDARYAAEDKVKEQMTIEATGGRSAGADR